MIPKIIHLCWLSGDPYPRKIQDCLDSWKKHLPSYEIILWDTKRFNIHEVPWVEQAFNTKKYAFAADYIRLYALYHHGGIYLAYIIHSGFISGYQNRYGDNLKPPTNVYHRMTA